MRVINKNIEKHCQVINTHDIDCKKDSSLSSMMKYINLLCHFDVEEWHEMQIHMSVSSKWFNALDGTKMPSFKILNKYCTKDIFCQDIR